MGHSFGDIWIDYRFIVCCGVGKVGGFPFLVLFRLGVVYCDIV